MEKFIKHNSITMTSERTSDNPYMVDAFDMDHWKCLIKMGNKRLTVYFSQGYGHNGKEPKLSSVLECLSSDSSSVQNEDLADFCANLGYDVEKGRKIYKNCLKQSKRVEKFLGADLFQTLMYEVES